MTSAAISVAGLTKRYGDRTAVDNIDIELPSGVVAGFVGPNGAGKTTTMAILLGLVRPTEGTAPCSARRSPSPRRTCPAYGAACDVLAVAGRAAGLALIMH
jgi:ABC-2 type transport system ATP-binding protein